MLGGMNRLSKFSITTAAALLVFLSPALAAPLSLPHFFSDHMVLQRDTSANIWGTAAPDTEVVVTFKGNEASASADET